MATSSFAVERRYRRRRQLAIFLIFVVVISLITLAVRYRSERRETADYLAFADGVALEELAVSDSLKTLFASLADFDRPAILQRISSLAVTTSDLEDQMGTAVVPRPAAASHGLMTVAVASWSDGVIALEGAVTAVMDQPDEALNVSPLVEAFDALRLGDLAYSSFVDTTADIEEVVDTPQFPAVTFVEDTAPEYLDGLARRLRLSRILDERRDISVSANTAPVPAGVQNGVAVMPYVPAMSVTAVVTNQGNVTHEEIEVLIELRRDGVDDEPVSETRLIPSLGPGASQSEEFADLPLLPGALYTVTVSAEVQDDADFDNNLWRLLFATNAE